MSRIRESTKPGHSRKFLVVLDNSPECGSALNFAAHRAESTGGNLILLVVIEPGDFQHWLGVEEIRRGEAMSEAHVILRLHTRKMKAYSDIEPEHVIREGKVGEEILGLIEEDPDIAILVLGASAENEGPRPAGIHAGQQGRGRLPDPGYHRTGKSHG